MITKKELLLKRGFSEYDIDTDFEHYNGVWNITTMTKEQVAAAKNPQQLAPLFAKDSVEYSEWCTTHLGRSFRTFAEDNQPFAVEPSKLDPHIARLCKAVNEIGVCTCMSCDGWHKSNERFANMKLYMKDRYSVIWFWLITEYIFGEKWHHQDHYKGQWRNIWEPFDFEQILCSYDTRDMMMCRYLLANAAEANAVFEKNNCYAVFLEQHREDFLKLRKHITDAVTEEIDRREIKHIDLMGFLEARRCMCEVFLPDAQPLADAFGREFPRIIKENDSLFNAYKY
ncbi:MAG: hypothetical protein ACI4KM_04800 [Oscillospiraceae bacterium]